MQFDIKKINKLKEILVRLRHEELSDLVQADFVQHFKNVSAVNILLMQLELINGDYGITIEDVKKLPTQGNSVKSLSSRSPSSNL